MRRDEHERDPIADHLAQLILRARQVDDLTEKYGPTRGRERQQAALEWALDELRSRFPASAERSVGIADRLCRMIAENRAAREREEQRQ